MPEYVADRLQIRNLDDFSGLQRLKIVAGALVIRKDICTGMDTGRAQEVEVSDLYAQLASSPFDGL